MNPATGSPQDREPYCAVHGNLTNGRCPQCDHARAPSNTSESPNSSVRAAYEDAAMVVAIYYGVGAHPSDPVEAQNEYVKAIRRRGEQMSRAPSSEGAETGEELIEKLRTWQPPDPGYSATSKLLYAAADRISYLRKENQELKEEIQDARWEAMGEDL